MFSFVLFIWFDGVRPLWLLLLPPAHPIRRLDDQFLPALTSWRLFGLCHAMPASQAPLGPTCDVTAPSDVMPSLWRADAGAGGIALLGAWAPADGYKWD